MSKSRCILAVAILAACQGDDGMGSQAPYDCVVDYDCQAGICPQTIAEDRMGYHRLAWGAGVYVFAENFMISEYDGTSVRALGAFGAADSRLSSVAVDEASVYGAADGHLWSMDRTTGEVRELAVVNPLPAEADFADMVLFGDRVIVHQRDSSIVAVPKLGGAIEVLAPPGAVGNGRVVAEGDTLLFPSSEGDLIEWSGGATRILIHAAEIESPGSEPWRVEQIAASSTEIRFTDSYQQLYVAARDGSEPSKVADYAAVHDLRRVGSTFMIDAGAAVYEWRDGPPTPVYTTRSREQPVRDVAFGSTSFAWFGANGECALLEAAMATD